MAADPYTAFLGGVGQGVGKGLGNAMSDTPASQTASSATYGTQLGGTGWVINFGSGSIDSKADNLQTQPPPDATQNPLGTLAGMQQAGGSGLQLVVLALVAAGVIYRIRKGR